MPHVTVQVQLGGYTFRGRSVESLDIRQAVGEHAECTLVFDRDPRATSSETYNVEAAALTDAKLQVVLEKQDDAAPGGRGGSPAAAATATNASKGLFSADGVRSAGVLTARAAIGAAVKTAITNRHGSGSNTSNAVLEETGHAVGPQIAGEVGHQLDFRGPQQNDGGAPGGDGSRSNGDGAASGAVGPAAAETAAAGTAGAAPAENGGGTAAAGAPAAAGTTFLAFDGVVREVKVDYRSDGGARFTVRAFSKSYELAAHADQRYFPKQTIAGLAQKLHVAVAGQVPAGQARDYAQVGESTYAFLARRAAVEGLQLRATWGRRPGESTPESAELGQGFAKETHALWWGRNVTEFAVVSRPTNHGVTGSFTDPATKHTHNFNGVRKDPQWLGGAKAFVDALTQVAPKDAGGGDPGIVDVGGLGGTQARNLAEFRTRLERASEARLGGAVQGRGVSTEPALRAGDLITIATAGGAGGLLPTAWQTDSAAKERDGTYGLVSVQHHWEHGLYKSTFVATPWAGYHPTPKAVEDALVRAATALGGADAAGSEHAGGASAGSGIELAVVTDDDDQKKLGRVRVQYRWMKQGEQSHWLRVAGLGGGKGHGVAAMPLKGNLVVVAFPKDDPEHPIVLMTLWDQHDAPGHSKDRQHWVSRSGSGLSLNAGQGGGSDHVELHTPGGKAMVRLNGSNITIHAEGDLAIEAPNGNVHIGAKTMSTNIEADATRFVGAAYNDYVVGQFVIESGATLALAAPNIQASADSTLIAGAGGTTQITGAPVLLNPE